MVKHGGGSTIQCGCFSVAGIGRFDGRMDAEKYRAILEENLMQTTHDFRLGRTMSGSIQPKQHGSGFRASF